MSYSYGSNYTPERLDQLNAQHRTMLQEIGAVYDEKSFWIAGMPKIRLHDLSLKISGRPFDLAPFRGRLVFHRGACIVATGDNPFPCDTTRLTLIRWGEGAEQCGRIETASMLNHTTLVSSVGIRIGEDVLFGPNVTVMDTDGHVLDRRLADNPAEHKRAPVVIEDHAWIGLGATIMKGVTVGHHAVVAANATVVKNVPPHAVVAGNPARIIKELNS